MQIWQNLSKNRPYTTFKLFNHLRSYELINHFIFLHITKSILLSNPIKILFIEPANHYEVLRVYALMFRHFGLHADIMSTKKNIHQISPVLPRDCEYYIIDDNIPSNQYLLQQKQAIDKYNLVILTTDEDMKLQPITKNWQATTFVIVHNFRTVFDYKDNFDIFRNILDPPRYIKYHFLNVYNRSVQAIKSFDGYLFPWEIFDHDKLKLFGKPSVVIPYMFNEFSDEGRSSPKTIVIPGTVYGKSRNYELIMSAISELNETLDEEIELVLLGSSYKRSAKIIIEKLKKRTGQKIKLINFEDEVDQIVYDDFMKKASFLLLPLNIYFTHKLIKSIGGRYSMSGSIGDMVRFGKKALITEGYTLPHFLEPHVTYFNSENLAQIMKNELKLNSKVKKDPYFGALEMTYFKNQIDEILQFADS
jgi:hypothetical protein